VTALIITLVAVGLILLRIPVAFALMAPTLVYILFFSSFSLSSAVERLSNSANSFPLLAVPLFILVGNIASRTGLADGVYDFAQRIVGRVRGGLAYVDVMQSLGFSWISGNAVSDVAMVGSVQVPQMQKRGYSNEYIGGMAAASSLVTPLMPPSIPAIIFGVSSGVSIGALFLASVVPALLVVALLFVSIFIYAFNKPHLKNMVKPTSPLWKNVVEVVPVVLAAMIVFGGIFGGVFTPTEAAAVVAGWLMLWTLLTRRLTWRIFCDVLARSAQMTGTLLIIVMAASLFGWMLTVERVPQLVASWITGITDEPAVFLLLMVAGLLLIGMLIDPMSAIIILTPVMFPVAIQMGVDPVHFGVVFMFSLLIGLFTPPVGVVLFVLDSVSTLTMKEITKGVLPYVILFIGVAILLVLVPEISLGLGQLLGG
jgi:tripartite ATP-independent transporter DctM subunit